MPVVQVAEQSLGEKDQMYRKGRLGRRGQIWRNPSARLSSWNFIL